MFWWLTIELNYWPSYVGFSRGLQRFNHWRTWVPRSALSSPDSAQTYPWNQSVHPWSYSQTVFSNIIKMWHGGLSVSLEFWLFSSNRCFVTLGDMETYLYEPQFLHLWNGEDSVIYLAHCVLPGMTSAETNRKPPFQTGLSSNKIYDLTWVEVRVKYNHWLSSTAQGSNIFCLSPRPFNGGGVVVLNADALTRNTDVKWEERLSHSYMFLFGSLVGKSCPTLTTPWTVARQAPLFMGFSRQEYWKVSHSVMSGSL